MNKPAIFAVTILLCLVILICLVPREEKPEDTNIYCRVECISDDGFIASVEGRNIFVVYPQPHDYELYDTIVMEFEESDLRKESGSRFQYEEEIRYTHVLENPPFIRPVNPGEPTFA